MDLRTVRRSVPVAVLALAATACGTSDDDRNISYRTFGQGSMSVQEVELDAVETVQEIAPGVSYNVWTFGGTAPGPVIRVTQGDTVRFTLTNKTSRSLSHSIDFHAAQTPWNVNYVPVAPGETLTFDWVARFPGVFMYHCGVPPVLHHIANGMYGAIIVEPKEPLPPAREYVLVSSEWYAGAASNGAHDGDVDAMLGAVPTHVVFNGVANLHVEAPLVAKPDELIRLWVMNAGPTLTNAFHVIGALFDHVYPDGNPTNQLNGIQTWSVPPGGGAMFELTIPDEGQYPFVTHAFAYTGLGSVGLIDVRADAPEAPARYPEMADPFDGGLAAVGGTLEGVDAPARPAPPDDDDGTPSPDEGVTVVATDLAFAPTAFDASRGDTVIFRNDGAIPHDLTIDELEVQVLLDGGGRGSFTLSGDPGNYMFYCSIPGHREAGMEGTVTVRA